MAVFSLACLSYDTPHMKTRLFLVFLLLVIPKLCLAELSVRQAISFRRLSDMRLSPDQTRIALTVFEPPSGTERTSNIWIVPLSSGEPQRFTTSSKSDHSARWSPDGKTLAFLSNRTDTTQIYLLSLNGGEAAPLTEGKNNIDAFEWSPDGTRIAFLAPDEKTDAEEKKEKEKDDARIVDQDDKPSRLRVIDLASKKIQELTAGAWSFSELQWLPDGKQLVVIGTDHPESIKFTSRIFLISSQGGDLKEIAAPPGLFNDLKVSKDGARISYLAGRKDEPFQEALFTVDLAGGQPRNIAVESIDREFISYQWDAENTLLALVENGFRSRLYRIAAGGETASLPDSGMNQQGDFAVTSSGMLVFVGETAIDPPEVWTMDEKGHASARTHFNKQLKETGLLQPEILRYKSFDGLEIEAALLKPAKTQAKLPLIVLVHGGPTGRWANSYDSWGQLLAAKGFAVFYPNIRGSSGYGHRFTVMNRQDWGGADFKDVMAGVDFLIAKGIADPQRLGIGGWSYGGYMAEWAITQTNRFKASVCGAGMSDIASEFGTEDKDTNVYDAWFNGLPYEQPEVFRKSSPVTYLKNAKTPTLILQGEADVIDPIGQSQQLYRALKHYGVETEFILYPREGHGLREEKHLIDRLTRIVQWYESHVK